MSELFSSLPFILKLTRKGAQPPHFHEPHIKCQKAACGSQAALWLPLHIRHIRTPDIQLAT